MRGVSCSLFLALAACHGGAAPPPTCPAVGPVAIHGPEDVAALATCARVPGLVVRTAAPVDLSSLTDLIAIDGDLAIGPTLSISTLSIPAVRELRGALRVSGNGDLTGLFLPALATAGAVEIVDDPSLASISAPALAAIDGGLTLARLPALELVDTSSLARVGGAVRVSGVPILANWVGPAPAVAGPVEVDAPVLDRAW